MDNRSTQIERNHIEAEVRAAQVAVTYYRKALEVERQAWKCLLLSISVDLVFRFRAEWEIRQLASSNLRLYT
jgi:hypothetical protein